MLKKTLITLVLSFALILLATPMVFGQKFQAEQIPLEQRLAPAPPAVGLEKGFCVIQNDDGSIAYYFGSFGAGDGVAAYMDPATCPDPPPYPFRVTDAHFYLYNFAGAVWPVQIQVNVRDLVGGDSCNGTGAILCSEVFTIPVDSSYGSLLRPMNLTISSLCCVNNPFFLEIVYTGGTSSPYPSPLFGSDVADTCNNWLLYGGIYYEWYNAWSPPRPGNIVLRATGNTHDPDCGPWPNHKMHFPQLPDLEGWDVLATLPKTLADDWQCSATGLVTDIHFWGSWKDIDGDPSTDDFPPGGQMPFFLLSIHKNIPADADTPWSRPGALVWEWYGEIPGTPFEPPTMEHWYDPNTGDYVCNDHVPYWRYDFVDIPTPFFQYEDSIYWLDITAMGIPTPYQWGWKTSRDHFMDDAVYTDTPPVGPWIEMYEPPRCNWFNVVFNSAGVPQDMGSTNYYGQGWYRYEYWTNMWFYDNPFVYRPKHIWLNFYIEQVGPTPYAEFAINWSTPAWDTLGMDRPPLPGEDEMLYIGRQVFPVHPGPNTIDYTLPYNPEWVSVDFVARDVMINGWIWHECIGTSMDLAFVITGEEVPCNPPTIGCPADETQNQNGVYTTTTQWSADDGNPADPTVELINVAVQSPLPPGISAANVNFVGPAPGPGLGVKSTWGTVTYTVSDHCQSGGPITLIATNNCPTPNNTATCTFNVALTNAPPDITQPDSLEGFVNSAVQYDISGNDPNGDVINDGASIQIVPSCGTYSITRTSGSGTSSGTWQVSWQTGGCTAGTYLVIHDLTDICQATSYCTTKVHLSEMTGWYWKPPYPDYAPNGMPDIDQKQDNWLKFPQQRFSFCGPAAVANCFKWFDSKYNIPPGAPCDGVDRFPLVRDYTDQLPPIWCGMPWDDHSPENMDHPATPWGPPIGNPPPATPQPFVPGPQPPGQMPPWGELVERLAWYFDTDGIQSGYCQFSGTNIFKVERGIDRWLASETLQVTPRVSTLADTLCEVTLKAPTFATVESLVEKSEDVILLLGFWYFEGEQQFIRGDVDEDGVVQMSDVVRCLSGPPFSCDDATDVNDDGVWNTLDCEYLSNFLMGIGPPPPPPFPSCGTDPTPDQLGCAEFPPCPSGPGQWYRCGGHYVTVAGVNSQGLQIAFSDPFFDNAERGGAGRVGNGQIIEHTSGHDATVHNDEGNVSHDIYPIVQPSPSPAGAWSLPTYPVSVNPGYCYDFDSLNIPDEFLPMSRPWNGVSPIFTEVEYAVHISPWDYRGDVNGDGKVNVNDVVYLINYLFVVGSPAPCRVCDP